MKATFSVVIALACLAVISPGLRGGEFSDEALGFAVTTDDNWNVATEQILDLVNRAGQASAATHARLLKKDAAADGDAVDSKILLLLSKLPIGSGGDNPNLILAMENAWAEGFEKSGAGYLELMKDRVARLKAPTEFVGEAKEVTIGGQVFFQMDAVNKITPGVETRQRYFCTFKNGHYLYFLFSFNDEQDDDYLAMIKMVRSFRKAE